MKSLNALAVVERAIARDDPDRIKPAAWTHLDACDLPTTMEFLAVRWSALQSGHPDVLQWARRAGFEMSTATALASSAPTMALAAGSGSPLPGPPASLLFEGGALVEVPIDSGAMSPDSPLSAALLAYRDLLRRHGFFDAKGALRAAAAFAEMASNAIDHSDTPVPAIACFQVLPGGWFFSVTDGGIGVTRSLSRNPQHAGVRRGDEALALVLRPGVSGTAEPGRGYGFTNVFKALVDRDCVLRFRSADAAADWSGSSPTEQRIEIRVSPFRKGFHVLVRQGALPAWRPS